MQIGSPTDAVMPLYETDATIIYSSGINITLSPDCSKVELTFTIGPNTTLLEAPLTVLSIAYPPDDLFDVL